MKLKCQMSTMNLEGKIIAVPLNGGEEFSGVLRMNDITADILKNLEIDITEDELVSHMLKEYDTADEPMRREVRKVVSILRENGLLS